VRTAALQRIPSQTRCRQSSASEAQESTPPEGLNVRIPLENDDDYAAALKELERLAELPLGTPATEHLQDLIDAIFTYEEAMRPRPDGVLH